MINTFQPYVYNESFLTCNVSLVLIGMSKGDSSRPGIDSNLAKQLEEELHAVLRRQMNSRKPVPFPRTNFWDLISDLSNYLETEVNRLGKAEGWSLRTQAAAKRQSNIRRATSELARKRLVSLLEHSTTNLFNANPFPGDSSIKSQELHSMDWTRHDPSERAFYSRIEELIKKFKNDIKWEKIQFGVLSEFDEDTLKVTIGTTQLDEFTDEKITEDGTPELLFVGSGDDQDSFDDLVEDDEERIAKAETFSEFNNESLELDERNSAVTKELQRIRIIKTSDDAFLDPNGNDFLLNVGDVHQIEASFANMLIEFGFAELANL